MELLRKENKKYRQMILAMQNEVYGARLAAKYLDKELAGRFDNNSNIKQLSGKKCYHYVF